VCFRDWKPLSLFWIVLCPSIAIGTISLCGKYECRQSKRNKNAKQIGSDTAVVGASSSRRKMAFVKFFLCLAFLCSSAFALNIKYKGQVIIQQCSIEILFITSHSTFTGDWIQMKMKLSLSWTTTTPSIVKLRINTNSRTGITKPIWPMKTQWPL
jgi:hypothetical protein